MSQVICEYCNATLTSKYVLKGHLQNNKACLSIRNLDFKTEYLCRGCNHYYTCIQKLSIHHETCRYYQCLLLKEEYDLKLQEKDQKILDIIQEKDQKIIELKEAHEKIVKELQAQIDKMFGTIEKLASQAIDKPTNVTTNNNVKNVYSDKYFLEKLTPEDIKHKCRNYLTEQIFFQGQRGIARMCTEHIIHTKDNKVLLTCSDVSRKKFKYVDEHGNIKEDYDARAFMEKVIGPIKQVSQEVYESILSDVKYEREELENKRDLESMERKTALHYKTDMAADCYRQIIFIDSNENHDFKNELAILNK